eukprot:TRINITY_DN6291_c1_g2_i2.p1 TRINITY_DN6291_c1_g2~~TRINITY_DN6291_c1_g2_i2.p1  ORF type:complete len:113 (-),score=53.33 TRINITY_DN6291_c1_g2_i2:58-396(-)
MGKFVKQISKPPCVPETEENCDKKDKAYLEEIKDMSPEKMKEEAQQMRKQLDELEAEHKAAAAKFEAQKDEAIATMKKADELKKSLSTAKSKSSHKLAILKAKTGESKKDEL